MAVIDDTVVYHSSTKAPGARYHHEHGGKVNRSEFVLGQNLVSLSIVVANGEKWRSLPLVHRLSPSIGNSGKLKGAKSILRFLKMPLGKWQKMTSCYPKTADALATHTPWWNPQEKTAGMLLYGVRRIFARLVVAECFDPKSKKFEIPEATQHEELKLAA